MFIEQLRWNDENSAWSVQKSSTTTVQNIQLVLAFGGRKLIDHPEIYASLKGLYPSADIVFCSTSGEFNGVDISEEGVVATAIASTNGNTFSCAAKATEVGKSYQTAQELALELQHEGLRHVFLISDGSVVNGTELARGFNDNLPNGVVLSGGLAGDAARFEKTVVGLNAIPTEGMVVAIGFYGDSWNFGYASAGGWKSFGAERIVTKSEGNILYEIEGKSALELYKQYLGPEAEKLPSSALRFPLSVKTPAQEQPLVRTILSINEEQQSMTFAGTIPQGATVQFMRFNYENLIDGAASAAEQALIEQPELALCVSCVGRRIVLGQRVEEELEAVQDVLGEQAFIAGFYSYGELAPFAGYTTCELHNQTMTITCISE